MNSRKWITALKMVLVTVALIGLYEFMYHNRYGFKNTDTMVKTEYGDVCSAYDFAMGTSIHIYTHGGSNTFSRKLIDSIQYLDEEIISWRSQDSELFKLNNAYEVNESYKISNELYEAISEAYKVCQDSGGALDITIRPLADVWNIEEADSDSFVIPDKQDIEDSLLFVGYEHIQIENNSLIDSEGNISYDGYNMQSGGAVSFDTENITIDLGAVGKGYALDYVKTLLDDEDISGAVISIGGSVLVYGKKADGAEFKVGIRNPKGSIDEMIGYLKFPSGTNTCVSTSGDYEKYFMVDGVRYHHILDRSTGYPVESGLSSVTVVCENGLYSDALSTACFVLGYEDSLPLLEMYNAEAIFIDNDNCVTVTDGLTEFYYEVN